MSNPSLPIPQLHENPQNWNQIPVLWLPFLSMKYTTLLLLPYATLVLGTGLVILGPKKVWLSAILFAIMTGRLALCIGFGMYAAQTPGTVFLFGWHIASIIAFQAECVLGVLYILKSEQCA